MLGAAIGFVLGGIMIFFVGLTYAELTAAMHSAVETAAVADADAMVRAVAGFYRVHLRSLGDARYTLE